MSKAAPDNSAPRQLTPLWVISLFVSFTEAALGIAATKANGDVQLALTVFVISFPVLIAAAFFAILWWKAYVFYPPSEYAQVDVQKYVEALRGSPASIVTKTSDVQGPVQIFGKPDRFKLLFKASGATWVRSTKAMEVPGGCLVQVSTNFLTAAGENGVEALSFIPGVRIANEPEGSGSFLDAPEEPEVKK
jgi:hypothetical protein